MQCIICTGTIHTNCSVYRETGKRTLIRFGVESSHWPSAFTCDSNRYTFQKPQNYCLIVIRRNKLNPTVGMLVFTVSPIFCFFGAANIECFAWICTCSRVCAWLCGSRMHTQNQVFRKFSCCRCCCWENISFSLSSTLHVREQTFI